ncbi:hypothetical protein ACWO4B_003206 [Clostridium sporogenes]
MKWSDSDIQFLKENVDILTYEEIGNSLNKTKAMVVKKTKKLKLKKKYIHQRKWTEEETKFLINNYKNMEYKEIAKKINRSYGGVCSKVKRMELYK